MAVSKNLGQYLIELGLKDGVSKKIKEIDKEILKLKNNSKDTVWFDKEKSKYTKLELDSLKKMNQLKSSMTKKEKSDLKAIMQQRQAEDKRRKQNLQEEAKLQKQKDNETKKAIKEQEKLQKQKDQEAKRSLKEQERLQKQADRDKQRAIKEQDRLQRQADRDAINREKEKARQVRETIKNYKELGNSLKSIGNTMSSMGKTSIGLGASIYGAVASGSNKYVDTMIDLNRSLAVQGKTAMNGTTPTQWEHLVVAAAKQYGVDSKKLADAVATTASGTSLHNTAEVIPLQAKLEYITGADETSLSNIGVLWDKKYKHIGFENPDEVGDYYTVFNEHSTASPDTSVKYLSEASLYTSEFDKYDPTGTGKVMAVASKQLVGNEGMTRVATGVRQLFSADVIRKDILPALQDVAKISGLSLDEYASSKLGIDLKSKGINGLDSLEDIHRLGAYDYANLITAAYNDVLRLDGTKVDKEGNVTLASEYQTDYLKAFMGSTRSSGLVKAMDSVDTSTKREIEQDFKRENMKGRMNSAVKNLDESNVGKLKKSMNAISETFMEFLIRVSPVMVGFMENILKVTEGLADMDFETAVEQGEYLADVFKTLIKMGIGLFIFGKLTTIVGGLISTVSGAIGLLNKFGISTSLLTTNLGRYWSAAMTNWSLGLNGGLKSVSLLAGTASTTAGKMAILGTELIALTGAVVWCYNAIKNLANDFAEFGQSKEYLQGREDAYNKKDTAEADAYNKMNSTALGKFFDDLSNGNYLGAAGDLLSTLSPTNLLGGGVSALLTYGSTLQGQEGLNFFQELLAKGYTNYETLAAWAEGKDNKLLDTFLSTISPDYNAYNKNQDNIDNVYDKYQGNYVEEGLADAESYFDKEKDKTFEDLQKEILEATKDDSVYVDTSIDDGTFDINDLADAVEEGAKDGTEKGVTNALSGDYNIPGSYTKLSQNGLAELVGFDNFGVKRTGNTVTMKNDININITADGQNADVIASIVEQRLSEFFRGSTLLDF